MFALGILGRGLQLKEGGRTGGRESGAERSRKERGRERVGQEKGGGREEEKKMESISSQQRNLTRVRSICL